jgi:adenine-specific DNA methylase
MCADAIDVEPGFDLVYIDPPYINRAGVGVDYRDFYHFLEGLVHYPDWPVMVDHSSRHRRLDRRPDPWSDPGACHEAFRRLLHRFAESILVISYRSEGTPSIDGLADMLAAVKRRVRVVELGAYQYALSGQRDSREMLLIGSD